MGEIIGTAWINGSFHDAADAKVSIFDSGFMGAVSVFDTLACWQGRLFKLSAHVERFRRSARAAMIPLLESGEPLEELTIEVTRRSGLRDAYVQLIATRGVRASPTDWSAPPTLIVYAIPYVWLAPPEAIDTGIRVITPSIRSTPPTTLDPKIKNFNRLHSYVAKLEADRAGVEDVVMLDERGYLTEGRSANLFLALRGALHTPAQGILHGITRETVFEIAAELGLPAHEGLLTAVDLYAADEAFFSTTAGGIIPIVAADGRQIGTGRPGDLTRRVHARYWERHAGGPDTTPVWE
jgi:branched-chain amino acid aminotransferase